MVKTPWVRVLLIVLGGGALLLGLVGVFVPLLPTTPFLLLAAACFVRSSERLYRGLTQHPWLGSYIINYREHRGMTARAKATALVLLWIVIGHSALLVASALWLRILLLAVAAGVTTHIALLGTVPGSADEAIEDNEGSQSELPKKGEEGWATRASVR